MPSQLSDPTPFTPEYIDGYLRKNDDFQLEIDVLNACRAAGFCANHGGTYQDPTLGKDRQFDIQAEWRAKNSSKILLAVECKNLAPENPFLVSRTPRSKDEAFHHALVLEFTVNGTNRQVSRVVDYGDYQRFEQVGKSICRIPRPEKPGVTKTGDSDIYGTWAQAVQSASSMLIETSRGMAGSRDKKSGIVAIPVLVVSDGVLWVADYDKNGIRSDLPSPVDRCHLFLGKTVTPPNQTYGNIWTYTISHLEIFTKSGFLTFLKGNVGEWADQLIMPILQGKV